MKCDCNRLVCVNLGAYYNCVKKFNMLYALLGRVFTSMTEAIRMYTNYSAYAGFVEKEKGSLEPGKLGDMIILSNDPWETDESEIENIKVICTILGGKIAYNPLGY